MAGPLFLDRVQATTTTTGTGSYAMGAATAGYQAWSAIGNGNTAYYLATDGTNWEIGLGTYASAGPTLARTSVKASSNAGSAVSWGAGNKTVSLIAPALFFTDISVSALQAIFNGGGSAIPAGSQGDLIVPFDGTITGVTMLADQTGSIVVDIWKKAYASYPPTITDSIVASAPPTISTSIKSQDTTLTGWTLAVSKGDVLRFNVNSCSAITRCLLQLQFLRV